MTTRKLVTLRTISAITPIEDADFIEQITIDGWTLVAQKGIHSVGDTVLYFEIDAFLPASDERFQSFMPFGISTFNEATGHRVKTKRLRGVYSQGVIIPISEFPEIGEPEFDVDYSELVGVVKWEKLDAEGNSTQKGNFPDFIPKTDQERIQNLYHRYTDEQRENEYVGTLKMDGSSITAYVRQDKILGTPIFGFCSRNQELAFSPEGTPLGERGKFEQGIINSGILGKLHNAFINGMEIAIQGELVGPGIQGNFEKHDKYEVYAFNIFHITSQNYLTYKMFQELTKLLELKTVPEVYPATKILGKSLDEILEMADGESPFAKYREGIVWKEVNGSSQFKAISNRYLSKEK